MTSRTWPRARLALGRAFGVAATVAAMLPAHAAAQDGSPAIRDAPEVEQVSRVRVELSGGFGLGSRSFERPTPEGGQRLEGTPFLAADLAVRAQTWRESAFSLACLLRYQTSLGMSVEARPLFALPNRVDARSERLEGALAPTFRLGTGDIVPTLAIPVGVALRAFVPETIDPALPAYSLWGPFLRAEVALPVALAVSLRFAPEVHWLAVIADSLRDDGAGSGGVAVGGEAEVRIELDSRFAVELAYRESHALVPGADDAREMTDVERYATVRVVGAP